jgi:glutamate racemase
VRAAEVREAVVGAPLRRLDLPEDPAAEPADVRVHLGGDEGPLPATACRYPIGAALAAGGRVTRDDLPVTDESDQQTRPDTASHPHPIAPPALRGV